MRRAMRLQVKTRAAAGDCCSFCGMESTVTRPCDLFRACICDRKLAGRVVFGIANDLNPPAISQHLVALGHAVARVVGALGVHVRMNLANQRAHVRLIEDNDGVHVFECSENLGALRCRHQRPARAFQFAHAGIGVDGDDQLAAQRLRSAQIAHVPDVQQIKASVGEDDRFALLAPAFDQCAQRFARLVFWLRRSRVCRRVLVDRAQQLFRRDRRRAAFHHHQPAGEVRQSRRSLGHRRPPPATR